MRRTAANSQRIAKSFLPEFQTGSDEGQHKTKTQTYRKAISEANKGLWKVK